MTETTPDQGRPLTTEQRKALVAWIKSIRLDLLTVQHTLEEAPASDMAGARVNAFRARSRYFSAVALWKRISEAFDA